MGGFGADLAQRPVQHAHMIIKRQCDHAAIGLELPNRRPIKPRVCRALQNRCPSCHGKAIEALDSEVEEPIAHEGLLELSDSAIGPPPQLAHCADWTWHASHPPGLGPNLAGKPPRRGLYLALIDKTQNQLRVVRYEDVMELVAGDDVNAHHKHADASEARYEGRNVVRASVASGTGIKAEDQELMQDQLPHTKNVERWVKGTRGRFVIGLNKNCKREVVKRWGSKSGRRGPDSWKGGISSKNSSLLPLADLTWVRSEAKCR